MTNTGTQRQTELSDIFLELLTFVKNCLSPSSNLKVVVLTYHVLIPTDRSTSVLYQKIDLMYFRNYIDNVRVNTTGVTSGAITAYHSGAHAYTPGFKCGSCCWIISFLYVVLKIIVSSFVFLFLPVYYLSFFDSRFLVTPLVSSYFSAVVHIGCERLEATTDSFASIIPLEYTTA